MKTYLYTSLLLVLTLFATTSCSKRKVDSSENVSESTTIIIRDTISSSELSEQEINKQLEKEGLDASPRKEHSSVTVVDPEHFSKLKKYNVVVATLSQPKGVEKLKKSFDKAGVDYFVVKSLSGRLFHFIVHSSDSEAEAIKARGKFLLENVVDKTRQEIWNEHEIYMTDTYILIKK